MNQRRWSLISDHGAVVGCVNRRPGISIDELENLLKLPRERLLQVTANLLGDNYIETQGVGGSRRLWLSGHGNLPFQESNHNFHDLLRLMSVVRRVSEAAAAPAEREAVAS